MILTKAQYNSTELRFTITIFDTVPWTFSCSWDLQKLTSTNEGKYMLTNSEFIK